MSQRLSLRKRSASGISLVEILVVTAILTTMIGVGFVLLATGQSTWSITDTSIQLQENLRQTVEKVSQELHGSGFDKDNVAQFTVSDGAGVNGTDIVRFSIPVVCHNGDNIMDGSGNIAHWGAPLTWGCSSYTCMDANDNCTSVEYKAIEYRVGGNNQLLRRVLDPVNSVVREETFANNIVDFQVTLSANQRVMTLSVTAQRLLLTTKLLTASATIEVYLRNRG